MKINDLEDGTLKEYCSRICARESFYRHFNERDFRLYLNDENVITFNSMKNGYGVFSNFYPCQ